MREVGHSKRGTSCIRTSAHRTSLTPRSPDSLDHLDHLELLLEGHLDHERAPGAASGRAPRPRDLSTGSGRSLRSSGPPAPWVCTWRSRNLACGTSDVGQSIWAPSPPGATEDRPASLGCLQSKIWQQAWSQTHSSRLQQQALRRNQQHAWTQLHSSQLHASQLAGAIHPGRCLRSSGTHLLPDWQHLLPRLPALLFLQQHCWPQLLPRLHHFPSHQLPLGTSRQRGTSCTRAGRKQGSHS
jgi:hypothetical protein